MNNAASMLSSFNPTAATAGDAALSLTISGSSFVTGAVATLGTTALSTTFVRSTELVAVVPPALLVASGYPTLFVANPAPSSSRTFTVNTR